MVAKKKTKSLEQTLWEAADTLRGNQEPSEYKHVVLGLVFLKYVSDRFEDRRKVLKEELASDGISEEQYNSFLEDRDEYTGHNVFWVPEGARWSSLQAQAKQPQIGQLIDQAMQFIEQENPTLRGVLPRNYGREGLDKKRLGDLVDLIGTIGFGTGSDHGSDDVLGSVYEYFLGQFAGKETGKEGGAFYTPRSVVQTLVEMLQPFEGRVLDPCCGSGGMFVQSAKFVEAHGGNRDRLSIYGQEFTNTTWKLAKMNLALRGIDADLGTKSADSFTEDLHPDLRADFIIANPPFNISDYWDESLADDPRWEYGTPRDGNANYAWIQHFLYHLAPSGTAGFVMANGALSSSDESDPLIRKKLVDADLVDCIVALPDRLFLNTGIPASLWFLSKGRHGNGHRERLGEVLFIDARELGTMITRARRELSEDDVGRIAGTYNAWRSKSDYGSYSDELGFCKAATAKEIEANNYILTPGRYVGVAEAESDGEPIDEKIERLKIELLAEFARGKEIERRVREILDQLR
ncbi:type I restriction-modification system subunit M [Arcanobacterium pinnipediorum]|uniref:site-specific DNA-methyltransferase (adenine-specific) n=1 Tax=Arcanobacterium pinnipediorum TaxID=1503041 RepID=A0ABY5AGR8_9ACTO|nr:class I SAM-dependent DNA methyltransferase [Arcanobacterium pinnipediorum]USR79035.1 type I restriction-modification system subunit M [Arcanobacterium pinnipediorum]